NVIDCGGGGEAHVSILKTADEPVVYGNDPIGFTITVTSDGTATALNVQVSDTLPTDSGTSWSIDGGTGAGDCTIGAGVLSCNIGDMSQGTSYTAHVSAVSLRTGSLTGRAFTSGPSPLMNASAKATITVS